MTAEIVTRSAQPGDICVLLRPVEFESEVIRRHQLMLQGIFGGELAVDLHLTCQRFEAQSPEVLERLVKDLAAMAPSVRPMPLTATHIIPFYSRFRNGHLLKIGIQVTDELRQFTSMLHKHMAVRGIGSLYRAHSQTTLVTALAHINHLAEAPSFGHLLPFHLFTAREIVVSRIKAVGDYELLATTLLE